MDSSERGASDLSPASGSGLLAAAPRLLAGGHRIAPPIPAAWRGVHRPEESQVRYEAAVGNFGVRAASLPGLTKGHLGGCLVPLSNHCPLSVTKIYEMEALNPPSRFGIVTDVGIKLSAQRLSHPGSEQMP